MLVLMLPQRPQLAILLLLLPSFTALPSYSYSSTPRRRRRYCYGRPVYRCPKPRCGTCLCRKLSAARAVLPSGGRADAAKRGDDENLPSLILDPTLDDAGHRSHHRTIQRRSLFTTIKETAVAIADTAAFLATRDTAVDSHVVVHGSFIPQLLFFVVIVVVLLLLLLPSTFVVVDAATAGAAAFAGQERSQMYFLPRGRPAGWQQQSQASWSPTTTRRRRNMRTAMDREPICER
jgi:hypothetical protein